MPVANLQRIVYASLMAALIAVGAYLHIPLPISPVPLVLQNLFVLLAGLLFGWRLGLVSVSIYLFVGALGMPVFVGGKGGLAHFVGPTGGYLVGFAVCAIIAGYFSQRFQDRLPGQITGVVLGSFAIYLSGVPWLKFVTNMSWGKAATVGMLPFLPGDALKACAALVLARALRPVIPIQKDSSNT